MKATLLLAEFATTDPRGLTTVVNMGQSHVKGSLPRQLAVTAICILKADETEVGEHLMAISIVRMRDDVRIARFDGMTEVIKTVDDSCIPLILPVPLLFPIAEPGDYEIRLSSNDTVLDTAALIVKGE